MKNILTILIIACISTSSFSQNYESNLSEERKKELSVKFKMQRQELENKKKEEENNIPLSDKKSPTDKEEPKENKSKGTKKSKK